MIRRSSQRMNEAPQTTPYQPPGAIIENTAHRGLGEWGVTGNRYGGEHSDTTQRVKCGIFCRSFSAFYPFLIFCIPHFTLTVLSMAISVRRHRLGDEEEILLLVVWKV